MHPVLQFFLTIIVSVLVGCLWGAATFTINQNKGYWNNGFWWGFWLGWIGLVVVLCKSDNHYSYYSSSVDKNFPSDQPHPAIASQPVPNGGWRCECGRVHAAYVSSCACGRKAGISRHSSVSVSTRIFFAGEMIILTEAHPPGSDSAAYRHFCCRIQRPARGSRRCRPYNAYNFSPTPAARRSE